MLLDAVWVVQGEIWPKRSYVRYGHPDLRLEADACVVGRLRRWLARCDRLAPGDRLPDVPRAQPSSAGMLLDAVWAVQGEQWPKRS